MAKFAVKQKGGLSPTFWPDYNAISGYFKLFLSYFLLLNRKMMH